MIPVMNIHSLVESALEERASDLILKTGAAPALRVDGKMRLTEMKALTADDTRELAYEILCACSRDRMLLQRDESDDTDTLMRRLEKQEELDVVFTVPKRVRVRANLFLESGAIGAALRIMRLRPASIEELNLPLTLKKMALEPHGLIIITGPTGSGKTTTLAAIVEEINRNKHANIFTIEDPIEYLFQDKKCVIHQREIGRDTFSFASALRSVTRQTPDVIAIGEMRDRETMEVALAASEIGHLVITTLHTTSAANTLDRIVNSFPHHLKSQICQQLSASLLCITSQRLLPHASEKGRIPAVEVLVNSPTVRKLLEAGETHELNAVIRDGSHFGMNTMNQALASLYEKQWIALEDALHSSGNASELRQMIRNH